MRQTRMVTALCWLALGLFPARLPAQQAPQGPQEFTAFTTDGRVLKLSQFRGKVLALEFLLTECPHCHDVALLMDKLQREYRAAGLQVIAVAFNPDAPAKLPGLVKKLSLSFPAGTASQLSVFQYLHLSVAQRYSAPFLAFVDRNGIVRSQFTGDDKLFESAEAGIRSNIEALLKRGPASGPRSNSGSKQLDKKQ